ncbi:hypothetical protein F5X98DRAFT_385308 [Xylaria grammica]|nr:hypothetical protein F5X98DRAFT_385308 [Xylaria grammica]
MGIGADTLAPMCFEKVSFMVLAILFILKAGGCYVPLDLSHPRARLKNMIDQCKPSLILSSAAQRSRMVDLVDVPVLMVDSALLKQCGEQPNLGMLSGHNISLVSSLPPAVITGPPKGILMGHGSVASNIMHYADIFKFPHENEPQDVVFIGGIFYDVNSEDLVRESRPRSVQCVWADRDRRARRWKQSTPKHKPEQYWNPVGGQLWIVDPDNLSVLRPVGCIGEIVISGPPLARGYLGDPEETATAFADNVSWFDGVSLRRLYETGDTARYRGDGTIEFLGRKDGLQVKFHGFRIGLGEIEAALHSVDRDGILTGVLVEKMPVMAADALVAFVQIKIQSIPNNRSQALLVSLKTLDHETKSSPQKISRSLSKLLPQYMIPSPLPPPSRCPHSASEKPNREVPRMLANSLTEDEVRTYHRLRDDDNSDGLAPNCAADHNTTRQARASSAVSKASGDDHGNGTLPTDTQNMAASFRRKALRRVPEFVPRLDQNLFSTGGNSVSAISLVADFGREGIYITVRDPYRLKSLSAMVEFVEPQRRLDATITQFASDIDKKQMITVASMGQANSVASRPLLDEVADSLDISPDPTQDTYPCTLLQEGIMFLSERTKGSYQAC